MKKFLIFLLIYCPFLSLGANLIHKSDFVMWQLPTQVNTIGNSYVFQMKNGKIAVMDGGVKEETQYLRGFIGALGNEVEAWFVSHPHDDHVGALNEILKDPKGIKIKNIYHSELSQEYYEKYETQYESFTREFYENLNKSGINVVNITEPGKILKIDKTNFKILSVRNPEITENPYNNQSMVIRVEDHLKSMVFLGDLGVEGGEKLLKGPFRKDLNCDYLQMAHHGQNGVSKEFYRSIKFDACLWPTPSWVYNNDIGKGFNTHNLKTIEIRNLMDEIGIKKHYISFMGLVRIDH
ncbi:MAG: MBL fold metallo-hydrolase [Bacteroidota bacterium]|nr:MBL fold metallo-hydrolase [Bacteroidota bacterium]MDP4205821.1 MBL fold metallo-hydrolase [Bacteroidota bacterium]